MKPDDVMIQPDRKAVEAQLAKARKRLERFPDSWGWLEQVGRCLRWLGDPQAADYFRQGAANYQVKEGHAGDQMRLGNLYRLAGDTAAAQRHFEQARALYATRAFRESPNPLDLEHMVAASFLVHRDDEVAKLIARLRAIDRDTDLLAYPISRLAEARHTRNADLAAQAAAELAAMIRRDRAEVWNFGGVLPWDWYQIALETSQRLSAGDSA
jgi:tetratricopeptide (TPR) repeat protein